MVAGKVLSRIFAPVFRSSYLRRSSSIICCANYGEVKQYYTLSNKHSLCNLALSFPIQKLDYRWDNTMFLLYEAYGALWALWDWEFLILNCRIKSHFGPG